MLAALALGLLKAMQPGLLTQQSGTLTRAQVRTMPPEELSRRLFGDLGRIMFAQPYYEPPRVRLRAEGLGALSFLTRPYRSGLAGVCRTDLFFVGFEPAFGAVGDDPPAVPARVQMYSNSYLISDLAVARMGKLTGDAIPNRSCGEIDPRTVTVIVAGSEGQVVDAVQRYADLLDGARAGRIDAALECRNSVGNQLATGPCLAMLTRYRAERIHVVEGVAGCGRAATDARCTRIETSLEDDTGRLEIVFETPRSDQPEIPPSRIRIGPPPPEGAELAN
jgi:hypothetical protein